MSRWGTATLAALVLTAACSSSTAGSRAAPDAGDSRRWVADGAPSAADLAAARTVVARRLSRLGATGAAVTATTGGLQTAIGVDPAVREAAGRRDPTELWTVTATAVGPCPAGSAGLPSLPAGQRCHTLGARVAGVEAVRSAQAELQPGIGWGVELFVDSAGYGALRRALGATAGRPVAVVADRQVVAVIDAGAVLGLHGRIAPGLTERQARRLAAALLVDDRSPVAFRPPAFGPEPGPFADKDFWLAALSAHVCGSWLPDAPTTPDASGIHSHGDGFVYAHPFAPGEAEGNATIGRWLGHGSWSASATELALWDGARHATGDACPDGRPAVVHWWLDGAVQTGDPGAHRVGNGDAIAISFDPQGVDPGPPPAAARLPLPRLTPEA